jgi:sec-independent protein translocase protein TatB
MFDFFSWSHILIMLVVALVVVGPKDLPRLMNQAGKWAGKARAMAGEFRRSFDEMARESELSELRKEIDNLKKNNPVTDLASSMTNAQADIGTAIHSEAVAPRAGEMAVSDTPPASGGGISAS